MGDLSQLVAGVSGTAAQRQQAQAVLVPQFGAAVQAVNADVAGLTDNLQAAVDDTRSPTLSGNLVTSVDSFRRGVESFTRGADPTGGKPDAAAMAGAQTELQTSLSGLAGVLVREMDGLLQDRLDTLDTRRLELLITGGVLVLLVLLTFILMLTGRRRGRGSPDGERDERGMSVTPARPEGSYGVPHVRMPDYGEAGPARRERSGALR
jgi:hypothetical protein